MSDFVQSLFILSIVAIVAIVYNKKITTRYNSNGTPEIAISKDEDGDSK